MWNLVRVDSVCLSVFLIVFGSVMWSGYENIILCSFRHTLWMSTKCVCNENSLFGTYHFCP